MSSIKEALAWSVVVALVGIGAYLAGESQGYNDVEHCMRAVIQQVPVPNNQVKECDSMTSEEDALIRKELEDFVRRISN